jgi:hypothetical protein
MSNCLSREDPNLLLISGTRGIRITDIREHGNFQSTLIVQNPLVRFRQFHFYHTGNLLYFICLFRWAFAVSPPMATCLPVIHATTFSSTTVASSPSPLYRRSKHVWVETGLPLLFKSPFKASHKIISKLGWHPKRHFHLSAVAKDSGNFYHFSISANAFRQHNQNAEPTAFHHRQTDARNETPEYSYASQIYSVRSASITN